MIYLIFVQYVKHKMQITQQRSEYDLMTNTKEYTQQTTSPKFKASAKNVHRWSLCHSLVRTL